MSDPCAPESLPPEVALQLFEHGAFLIIKDFPAGQEFGIDYKSWTVGERFLGVKMIPPGVHFVYASCKTAPRLGFFHCFKAREVVVRRWDRTTEALDGQYEMGEEGIERIRGNLKTLDSSLGPYPYSCYRQWVSLSSCINERTLDRLNPSNALALITSQVEMETKEKELERQMGDGLGTSVVDRQHPARVRLSDAHGLPLMRAKKGSLIRFSTIPQISLADCSNLKTAGIDSSERLYSLLKQLGGQGGYKELLAEFQYAFVVFLLGQVYDGFEQWKRLIHLLCSCQRAMSTHSEFFAEFLMVLHYQLKECGEDFFADALAADNFLVTTLALLFANIEDHAGKESELSVKSRKFKALLERRFKRRFDLPDD